MDDIPLEINEDEDVIATEDSQVPWSKHDRNNVVSLNFDFDLGTLDSEIVDRSY